MLSVVDPFSYSRVPKQVCFCYSLCKSLEPVFVRYLNKSKCSHVERVLRHFTRTPTYIIKVLSHIHTPSGPSCPGVGLGVIVSLMGASLLPRAQFVIERSSAEAEHRAWGRECPLHWDLKVDGQAKKKKCLQQQDLKCHLWAGSHLPL